MAKYMDRFLCLMIIAWLATCGITHAITNYWDPSTNAGWQHGDGTWSVNVADTNWGTNGTAPRLTWTNGFDAFFASTLAGSSRIIVSSPVTAGVVSIYGNNYNLDITNSGRLYITNGMTLGTGVANNPNSNNIVRVIGGAGVTSVWDNGLTSFTFSGRPSQGNTFIVDGAGVAGSALATNMQDINVGQGSIDAAVIVTNKGILYGRGLIKLGAGSLATTNS